MSCFSPSRSDYFLLFFSWSRHKLLSAEVTVNCTPIHTYTHKHIYSSSEETFWKLISHSNNRKTWGNIVNGLGFRYWGPRAEKTALIFLLCSQELQAIENSGCKVALMPLFWTPLLQTLSVGPQHTKNMSIHCKYIPSSLNPLDFCLGSLCLEFPPTLPGLSSESQSSETTHCAPLPWPTAFLVELEEEPVLYVQHYP